MCKLQNIYDTKNLLRDKFNLLSVNQLNAQIKLCDVWKAVNVDIYPTKVTHMTVSSDSAHTRSITNGKLVETGKSELTQATFIDDAIKAWNSTSEEVKQSNPQHLHPHITCNTRIFHISCFLFSIQLSI